MTQAPKRIGEEVALTPADHLNVGTAFPFEDPDRGEQRLLEQVQSGGGDQVFKLVQVECHISVPTSRWVRRWVTTRPGSRQVSRRPPSPCPVCAAEAEHRGPERPRQQHGCADEYEQVVTDGAAKASHPASVKPELVATAPNQVWSSRHH